MTVRAKFKCYKNECPAGTPECDKDTRQIGLEPVYDSNPDSENGKFFKYTPSGKIELHCINPAANEQFVVGKEYYVDFNPVE